MDSFGIGCDTVCSVRRHLLRNRGIRGRLEGFLWLEYASQFAACPFARTTGDTNKLARHTGACLKEKSERT